MTDTPDRRTQLSRLLARLREAGWQHTTYGIGTPTLGPLEHVWRRGGQQISWYCDEVELTGGGESLRIRTSTFDLDTLGRLALVMGLLPPAHRPAGTGRLGRSLDDLAMQVRHLDEQIRQVAR